MAIEKTFNGIKLLFSDKFVGFENVSYRDEPFFNSTDEIPGHEVMLIIDDGAEGTITRIQPGKEPKITDKDGKLIIIYENVSEKESGKTLNVDIKITISVPPDTASKKLTLEYEVKNHSEKISLCEEIVTLTQLDFYYLDVQIALKTFLYGMVPFPKTQCLNMVLGGETFYGAQAQIQNTESFRIFHKEGTLEHVAYFEVGIDEYATPRLVCRITHTKEVLMPNEFRWPDSFICYEDWSFVCKKD